ncbi:MAG TPA: FAD:protein FMN transferase [Solirubrobacteraceae bacterium]|nr:FAD:protein FMN transferase [Solirubrobacteraceae bacterium]
MAEHRVEHVMGMPVEIDVRDPGVDPAALDGAFDWLRFVDATFSPYRPGSEISRLDRGELALHDAHPVVREVLERCEHLRVRTGGFFDPRARGGLDPSGLVKGWSVDRVAALLEAAGARDFCVNAGGDVLVRGAPEPGERWRVGIRHPRRRDRLAAVLALTDAAVATSGAYERGEHIVDPRSGRPPAGVLAVTVVGPDLATADAHATAAFAMGVAGPAWTAGLRGHEAMTILAGDRVLATPGFVDRCAGASVAASLQPA